MAMRLKRLIFGSTLAILTRRLLPFRKTGSADGLGELVSTSGERWRQRQSRLRMQQYVSRGAIARHRPILLDDPHADLPLAISLEQRAGSRERNALVRRLPFAVCDSYLPLGSREWKAGRHRLDARPRSAYPRAIGPFVGNPTDFSRSAALSLPSSSVETHRNRREISVPLAGTANIARRWPPNEPPAPFSAATRVRKCEQAADSMRSSSMPTIMP